MFQSEVSRRQVLQAAIAAGAATIIPAAQGARSRRWHAPGNRARRRLVEAANFGRKQAVRSRKGIAVCTHPLASQAAADMLEMGGNACDAIMAASMAQAVVEPHMTTLSGCLSMLYYDAASGEYSYVNGMMAAPAKHPALSASVQDLMPMLGQTRDATMACIPGFWGGFEAGHDRHGKLPRATVMAPAIHYAREGFEIHPFLWGEMFIESAALGAVDFSRDVYFRDQALMNSGDLLVQGELANTLERLVSEGSDYFYRGEFGRRYAAAVQAANGSVSAEDMATYEPFWDKPARGTYRDYEIIASPSPDFGGEALIQIMNMAELLDIQKLGPAFDSAETTLKLMQMVGRVYTDETAGRMAGTPVDRERLLSKELAADRFSKLSGKPASVYDMFDVVPPPPPPGSNHVTVVDAEGNVATILHSVMSMPFTTRVWVDGVYVCASGVHFASGLPEPRGRAFARICPNMFAKDGKPVLASGSPSVSLTENIVQNSINMLDFGMDIGTAVHKPRFGGNSMADFKSLMVEADMGQQTIDYLRKAGAEIEVVNPWNWTHGSFDGIRIEGDVASACGDPRRTAQAIAAR